MTEPDPPSTVADHEQRREDFAVLRPVPTRWSDVDTYGHINNAVHYQLMDTAVNGWLVEATGTDIRRLDTVGWVLETSCRYLAQLHFPVAVEVGIGLIRVGRTSVTYGLALFGSNAAPAAVGRFVHVYVDLATSRPAPVPEPVLAALATLDTPDRPLRSAPV